MSREYEEGFRKNTGVKEEMKIERKGENKKMCRNTGNLKAILFKKASFDSSISLDFPHLQNVHL